MRVRAVLGKLDLPLLGAAALLLCIGLLVLFAINFKDPSLAQEFSPARQLLYAGVGGGLLVLFARLDFRLWARLGKHWYLLGLGLLLLVLGFGKEAQGAVRALDLGILQFQPTEFIKLGLIMMLGATFAAKAEQMARWHNLGLTLVLSLVPALLVAIQPDLGSAIVVMFIWGVMVLFSHARRWHLLALLGAALVVLPLFFSHLHAYQQQRIYSFLHPQADPQGSGYNVVQSTIAVGSGQLLGKGLGSGTQSQLNFIPSQHTDFIFAVTAEKLGLLGAGTVLMLFGVILVRAILIAKKCADRFGQFLALGIAAMFFVHVLVNIGMNLGIMPVTGLPLPFLSYGGTNLIISLIAIGILESIRLNQPDLTF